MSLFYFKQHWKIIGLVVLLTVLTGCFSLAYFFYDKTSSVNAESNSTLSCSGATTISLPNTTFLKSYRILTFTKINGAWPTKDGGYIISGITDPNIMFIPPDGFVAKLDKQGGVQWMKLLKTKNATGGGNMMNPNGEENVMSAIELKDGGYLLASYVDGFTTNKEFNTDNTERNKILLTRLDKSGNMVWNKSFIAFAEDAKNSLLETADNGFLFYTNILDLAPDKRGEDSDVYQDLPFASLKVVKFDKSGNVLWSKNIKNFIARENDSYLVATPDGGYVLAGNIAETNPEKELPYNFDIYPGLAKFDKDFNFEWAKSMESTPIDIAAAIPKAGGGFELGWKKMRQGALVVHGMVKTKDNGYLILGNIAGMSLLTDSFDLKAGVKNWLVGFKFSSSGNLEWVKKLTFGFNEFTMPMVNFSMIATVDNKIMVVGPITWADDDYVAKTQETNEQVKWYKEKYGEAEMAKEDSQKTKQSREDYKRVKAVIQATQDAFRPGIFMMKMDDELNTNWAKVLNPHRSAVNYVVKPTTDSGAIIAGEYGTNVVKSIMLGEPTYYKDGFVAKLDASGNIKDNKNWVTNYNGKFVAELMTPYTVTKDLIVQVDPFDIKLISRKPEFSPYKKSKTTVYAPFQSAKDTLCPSVPEVSNNDVPLVNSTITSTAQKTWPQINYEKAVPVEPINDKSRTLNSELLPILNITYKNQVKLIDNMGGSMLSYMFGRVVTKDDLLAVKNYLVGIGYKIQDEGQYQLTMYKVGYFLNLTFSVGNQYKAFLNVTY
jgi:hypothetical protein